MQLAVHSHSKKQDRNVKKQMQLAVHSHSKKQNRNVRQTKSSWRLKINTPQSMLNPPRYKKGQRSSDSRIVQELYESRGGRPGLSVLTSLLASVDVKQH